MRLSPHLDQHSRLAASGILTSATLGAILWTILLLMIVD
jgi:hypothetical protein